LDRPATEIGGLGAGGDVSADDPTLFAVLRVLRTDAEEVDFTFLDVVALWLTGVSSFLVPGPDASLWALLLFTWESVIFLYLVDFVT
jgi:hypothetical protein